jgi:hypothetical protein
MHLQNEASPHLLNHCRCLLPPSRQMFPPCSPTSVPLTLFSLPPAQSHSKMKASGALVGPLTGESLEPPKYVSCSRIVEFQAQTQEVISYKKAHDIRHARTGQMAVGSPWYEPSWGGPQIPRGRTRIPWPPRPSFPEHTGHRGEESSLSPSHLCLRRVPPPIMVMSLLRGRRLSEQAERQPTLRSKAFRPSITDQGPCQ